MAEQKGFLASTRESVNNQVNNLGRSLLLRFKQSRTGKNIETLVQFQSIYYTLINADLPLLKGTQRKNQARKAQLFRSMAMMSGMLFFLLYSRMGMFNRLLVALIGTNSVIFFNKSIFYMQCVEEAAQEMTLTGQEARILVRYYFPDYPTAPLLKQKCEQYKQLSEEQKKKEDLWLQIDEKRKERERKLDQEFEEKLKQMETAK